MNPSSIRVATRKITFYLVLILAGKVLAGFLTDGTLWGNALADLFIFFFMLLPVLCESKRGLPLPSLECPPLSSLPLFFLLPLLALSVAWGWSLLVPPESVETASLPVWYAVLFYALLPALFEELFFRHYLLFSLHGEKGALGGSVLLSALLFSLSHSDFYQMPYAFFAGLLLALAAVMSGSVLLPFLMHLLNNLCSLYLAPILPIPYLLLGLAALFLLSLLFVLLLSRKRKSPLLSPALTAFFSDKEGRRRLLLTALSSPIWVFLALAVCCTVWKG